MTIPIKKTIHFLCKKAVTGSGKTLAFIIPVVEMLRKIRPKVFSLFWTLFLFFCVSLNLLFFFVW